MVTRNVAGRSSQTQQRQPPDDMNHEIHEGQVCCCCCYVLFDVQTTGGNRTEDEEIIELAMIVLGPDGTPVEHGYFETLVRPQKQKVSTYVTDVTGITNEMVQTAPDLSTVMTDFFDVVNSCVETYCGYYYSSSTSSSSTSNIDKIILVAHNGRRFAVPFLVRSLERTNLNHLLTNDDRYGYTIDTLDIAERIFSQPTDNNNNNNNNNNTTHQPPTNRNLQSLYQFVKHGNTTTTTTTEEEEEEIRRSSDAVYALYCIFQKNTVFWKERWGSLLDITVDGTVIPLLTDDSDASFADSDSDDDDDDYFGERYLDRTTIEQIQDDDENAASYSSSDYEYDSEERYERTTMEQYQDNERYGRMMTRRRNTNSTR
ncbi:DNA polymerase III PolC-type [Nitzschia inconspicua]|uniref:DNA polymerase III PolC-type n=1 Tax=Nitzschia inconspicua TaxID=303405 RepID=A0A9K3KUC4_9STRA|nr:DNA polymerase III PolC-type [Nitzschia inconspicua]